MKSHFTIDRDHLEASSEIRLLVIRQSKLRLSRYFAPVFAESRFILRTRVRVCFAAVKTCRG